jgi:hypothetical protein
MIQFLKKKKKKSAQNNNNQEAETLKDNNKMLYNYNLEKEKKI